jgi:uncharacterized protein (DUF1330 family)
VKADDNLSTGARPMSHIDLPLSLGIAFKQLPDGDKPVAMLNLLRYRAQADYAGHPEQTPCSGRDAYRRYVSLVMPLLGDLGAKTVFLGQWQATLIGAPGETWDDLLLVEYPNRDAFQSLMQSPKYHAVMFHRQAALADSRLIAFRPGSASFQD